MRELTNELLTEVYNFDTIAIAGHIRPDGDCVGSCMGLYSYINSVFPQKTVSVLIDEIPDSFTYLKQDGIDKKLSSYDLFISLDCGDVDRLGDANKFMDSAKLVINVDHHRTNTFFGDINIVKDDASSTSEIIFSLLDYDKITYTCACALYTGIVHDTGVFKHDNTSAYTMKAAGMLMDKDIPFGKIIDESFYLKTYKQLQIMGRCLLESVRVLDGKCIFSVLTKEVLKLYEAKPSDLDGIIDELRTTKGVEVAILLDERFDGKYKVSMRSNSVVDVSEICKKHGGGGHKKAAGCELCGTYFDVINALTVDIEKQLEEYEGNS